MAFSIQWRRDGAVKYFTGTVTFDDVIQSEREVTGNANFTALKYVISMYLNTRPVDLSDSERIEVRALRLGGYYSNPRIKYAFVTDDANVKDAIEKSVIDGQTLHSTRVYETYEDAVAWVIG